VGAGLADSPGKHFASVNAGIQGALTRQNLAAVYHTLGRYAEAERHWQGIVEEQADYPAAWLGLGEIYLAQGRWHDLPGVERQLQGNVEGELQASLLRARALLGRKEFAAARDLVQGVIARNAGRVEPRVLLSHVSLQEGRDWKAAETALLAILELDPQHKEAQHNLAVLHQQQRPNGRGSL
jgi:tetratricopeptide (TPR) repeat protein